MILLAAALLLIMLCLAAGLVSVTVQRSVQGFVGGSQSLTVSADNGVIANPTVPAAQPVATFTHTTNTTGSMVMTNTSHGITTGQRIDIYWPGGQCYGAVAGTVSGTTVPIASVSGGDNLPATSTVGVVVGIATTAPFNCVGDNLRALILSSPNLGYMVFSDGADLYAPLVQAGGLVMWTNQDGVTNPLAGDTPTAVFMSHNSTDGETTFQQAAAVVQ